MNTPTKPVEQKARELLAVELSATGDVGMAADAAAVRNGAGTFIGSKIAIRAIIAALNTDEERIRRLEEALEPFAKAFDNLNIGKGVWIERPITAEDDSVLKIEHFRAARDALSTPSKEVVR